MDFSLKYEGLPGEIQAELSCDGEVIATAGGFTDEDEIKQWARDNAKSHKDAVEPPEAVEPVSGEETLSL